MKEVEDKVRAKRIPSADGSEDADAVDRAATMPHRQTHRRESKSDRTDYLKGRQ